jgi:hypothetical protein
MLPARASRNQPEPSTSNRFTDFEGQLTLAAMIMMQMHCQRWFTL